MAKKDYDKQVREWWSNKFSNTVITFNSFFETLKEEKVQMISYESYKLYQFYQVFQIIEGDILLVRAKEGYFILYQRQETFIRLIFPFDEDYNEDFLKEEN